MDATDLSVGDYGDFDRHGNHELCRVLSKGTFRGSLFLYHFSLQESEEAISYPISLKLLNYSTLCINRSTVIDLVIILHTKTIFISKMLKEEELKVFRKYA